MKSLLPLLALALLLAACSSTPPRRVHWQSPGYAQSRTLAARQAEQPQAKSRAESRKVWESDASVRDASNASATRRNLYSPSPASGPYTTMLQDGSWKRAGKTADVEMQELREQQEIQAMKAGVKAKE